MCGKDSAGVANKACFHAKTMVLRQFHAPANRKRRLPTTANKASLQTEQGFLASQPRLHHAKTPLFRLCGMSGTAVQTALFWNPKYVKVCENTAHYTPKNRKLWIMYRTLVSICKESGQNKGKQRAISTERSAWQKLEVTEFQTDFKKNEKTSRKICFVLKKKAILAHILLT